MRNRFFIPAYWLLAAVLACIVTLSLSFWQYGTAEGFTGVPWRSLMQIAWRTAAYALLGTLLDRLLNLSAVAKSLSPFALGGGLLLCWLPYLYWIFPGTVSNDSVTQVLEIIGVEKLGNANPIFQTALIYFFRGVGKVLGSADAGRISVLHGAGAADGLAAGGAPFRAAKEWRAPLADGDFLPILWAMSRVSLVRILRGQRHQLLQGRCCGCLC